VLNTAGNQVTAAAIDRNVPGVHLPAPRHHAQRAFELLPLLPPQLATPTAMRRIAAPLARKVIGLLRFTGVPPVRVWNHRGCLRPGRLSSA
jgi:hypothetical protein